MSFAFRGLYFCISFIVQLPRAQSVSSVDSIPVFSPILPDLYCYLDSPIMFPWPTTWSRLKLEGKKGVIHEITKTGHYKTKTLFSHTVIETGQTCVNLRKNSKKSQDRIKALNKAQDSMKLGQKQVIQDWTSKRIPFLLLIMTSLFCFWITLFVAIETHRNSATLETSGISTLFFYVCVYSVGLPWKRCCTHGDRHSQRWHQWVRDVDLWGWVQWLISISV